MSAFGGDRLLQPPRRRWRSRRALARACSSSCVFAPGLRRRRSRAARRRSRTCACSQDQERRRGRRPSTTCKRVRGGLLVQDRDTGARGPRGDAGGHRAPADRRRVGRAAVRLAGLQARALERDRARARPAHGGRGRGADEPRGLGAPRGRQGRAPGSTEGAALASDAFFPFADGPQLAIEAGRHARSSSRAARVRDHEVVDACDAAGVAMVFTRVATSATEFGSVGRAPPPDIRPPRGGRLGDASRAPTVGLPGDRTPVLCGPAGREGPPASTSIERSLELRTQVLPMREPHHPSCGGLELPAILHALSDPARLEIVRRLSNGPECTCGTFELGLSKATLSTTSRCSARQAWSARAPTDASECSRSATTT